ncbi:uncharacterized protein LOC118186801 isoform X2 [Stegodyphus dumicola]|uniref:uncharacterized protein LOC118186801 isoform X2 n=1 Tax=Stegodyphus dumicola TaxID=202533 RepID=UPI0015B32BB4|nr:uncharacterized protein LOC118186801 isoform X2 [Stegodyphus dumicola]
MLSLIFIRSLLILTCGAILAVTEIFTPNLLQRGATSKNWIWKSSMLSRTPEIQRRRRFLAEEPSEAWWKDMIAPEHPSFHDSLNPSEKSHFTNADYPPPFENAHIIHDSSPKTKSEAITPVSNQGHPDDIDQSLLHKAIIDEFHRPSKIEFESASQRLREASEITRNSPTNSTGLGRILKKHHQKDSLSKVEYVIPGVEHVVSHVQYANKDEDEPPPEIETVVPQVRYVVPKVAYVEPETEYQEENQQTLDSSERRPRSFSDADLTDSYANEKFPEESISIGRQKLPEVDSATSSRRRPIQSQDEESLRSPSHRKLHGAVRNHEDQLPAVESLPVEQFHCSDVSSAGYYADISSRCQVFHICHENGQRSTFLCPIGTLFNQEYLVCDWWYNVDCGGSLQNNYAAETLQAFSSNTQQLSVLTQSNRIATEVDNLQEIPYNPKHIEDPKRSLRKQKFHVSTPSNGFETKKTSLQQIHNRNKHIGEDPTKFFRNQQSRVSTPGYGFTEKKINLQPIRYGEEHIKQGPSAEKSSLQKAVNYLDRYVVLLWEHMKNSPIKIHVLPKNTISSHYTGKDSSSDSPKHAADTNKNNRKSPSKTKETNQQNKPAKCTPIKKQRQNKRYFGGLKPFVHTTTKTAKVLSYNYHNDKTLIEILPPNLSDKNFTTLKPSIEIKSSHVKEIIQKNLLLHKHNFTKKLSPVMKKDFKSQNGAGKDIPVAYKNSQDNTTKNKYIANAKFGEIVYDFPKFSYVKMGNINNNNNNSYFNYHSVESTVKFEKIKSNESKKEKYNASKIQHNDPNENKVDNKSTTSNKKTTKLLNSTTKTPKITNKIIRNYNRTAVRNGEKTDKELRFSTVNSKGIRFPEFSQILKLNGSRRYGDRLSFNANSFSIFNIEKAQKNMLKTNIAARKKGKKHDKAAKQEKNTSENLQNNRTNQISSRANKTKISNHKTSNNKTNMQRRENNIIPNSKSERMFHNRVQNSHPFVSRIEESKKEAEKHINKNFTISFRVQAKELLQINNTKHLSNPNIVRNVVQNNSIKTHHLKAPYVIENSHNVNHMTNKRLNESEMLRYRKQNITKIKHKHGGFVVIKKVKVEKKDHKMPLNLTESADVIKPNTTSSLELNSGPNDHI